MNQLQKTGKGGTLICLGAPSFATILNIKYILYNRMHNKLPTTTDCSEYSYHVIKVYWNFGNTENRAVAVSNCRTMFQEKEILVITTKVLQYFRNSNSARCITPFNCKRRFTSPYLAMLYSCHSQDIYYKAISCGFLSSYSVRGQSVIQIYISSNVLVGKHTPSMQLHYKKKKKLHCSFSRV